MKIGLISGHGAGDSGAFGCGYKESDLNVELVKLLDSRFKAVGVETVIYPYERNAYKDACTSGLVVDFSGCNYVLEVHFNACVNDRTGNGVVTGTEIYVTPREVGISVEKTVLVNMDALGFTNRGVKVGNYLVINKIKDMGISSALIETCFIDDKDDMDLYQAKKNEVVDAIVSGVTDGFGFERKKPESVNNPAKEDGIYRVQVGAYTVRGYAERQLEAVKAAGFEPCMVRVDGYYKVQVGAYVVKDNAIRMLDRVKAAGFDAFITTVAND